MSFVKTANVQIGTGPSASNNFHWRNLLDGLLRLSRGNAGSPITDVMRVKADDSVEFPGGYTGSADDEKRRCTAWVHFTNAGVIRDSYNVSSITDNGVGDFFVNFASSMANTNYAAVGTTAPAAIPGVNQGYICSEAARTTASVRVATTAYDGTRIDPSTVSVSVFGGK